MNCFSFYSYGTLFFALGLIGVVSAEARYNVNSVDAGGNRFGSGVLIFLKNTEPRRFGYAEKVEGNRRPADIKAVWQPGDIKYFESSDDNKSIQFEYREGKMHILNFANVNIRARVEQELRDLGVSCKIDGVITPNPRKD